MSNYTYASLKNDYSEHWAKLEINSAKLGQFQAAAHKITAGMAVYKSLESQTGIPWYFIGLLHYRESDCNFHTHLHNGDSLNARTYHVPAGRPRTGNPPFTFEFSALDALSDYKGQDWTKETIEKISFNSERFNGFGYRMHGVPSAYLYAGTNQYTRGKYVSDGVWSASTVDTQLGCMGILKIILATNVTISAPTLSQPAAPDATYKASIDKPTDAQMNAVSDKHWYNSLMQRVMATIATFTGLYKGLDTLNLESMQSTLVTIKSMAETIGSIGIVVASIALLAYLAYQNHLMKNDVIEGRSLPSGGDPVPTPPEKVITVETSV